MQSKNIIIAGFPKSGTMWTTRLVAQIVGCPVKGYWGLDYDTTVKEGESRTSSWNCYISHHLYSELTDVNFHNICKIIYVVRDPRDIVVSGIFHFNFYHKPISILKNEFPQPGRLLRFLKFASRTTYGQKRKIQRMINLLINGDPYINQCQHPWGHHVNSYLAHDVIFVKYEDLLNNGTNTLKQILSYLGETRTEDEIADAIAQQSFGKRKKEFIEKGDKIRARHLRIGKSGDWKYYLSDYDCQVLSEHYRELMVKFNYIP